MSMAEELEAILQQLSERVTTDSRRTKVDRYREFRQLFLGSELGQRVLLDILVMGRIGALPIRDDTHKTYLELGHSKLALEI